MFNSNYSRDHLIDVLQAQFYASDELAQQVFKENDDFSGGSMLPSLRQLANVAALPGIVGMSLGMPDIHSGYQKGTHEAAVL